MKICINRKYETRNGDEVTIYRTGAKGGYPVHGCIIYPDGREVLACWTSEGEYYSIYEASENDLVEVQPTFKFLMWVNVYEHNVAMSFATLEAADRAADSVPGRLACIPVKVNGEYGEGIDDEDS